MLRLYIKTHKFEVEIYFLPPELIKNSFGYGAKWQIKYFRWLWCEMADQIFPMLDKFATILEARQWSEKFVCWYNNEHLHSAIKFITPHQRHSGEDEAIRFNRHQVDEAAKAKHPERWAGKTRYWSLTDTVTLHKPNKKKIPGCMTIAQADYVSLKVKLPEQERLDGAGDGSGQTANAGRQYG